MRDLNIQTYLNNPEISAALSRVKSIILRKELTYLLAKAPNRLVVLVEYYADFIHKTNLFSIVPFECRRSSIDVGEQTEDAIRCDRLIIGDSGDSSGHRDLEGGMAHL